jgi:hypothetical protein
VSDKQHNEMLGPASEGQIMAGNSLLASRSGPPAILPQTRCLNSSDEAFAVVLNDILPADVAPVLLKQLESRRQPTTALSLLLLLGFLLIAGILLYIFFPGRKPLSEVPEYLLAPDTALPRQDPLYAIQRQARKALHQQDFQRCEQLLQPYLDGIIEAHQHRHYECLLFDYFHALQAGLPEPATMGQAKGALVKLCEQDPENINWKLFYLFFRREEYDYQLFDCSKYADTWQSKSISLQSLLNRVHEARKINRRWLSDDQARHARQKRQLDWIEAQILLLLWKLEGGQGTCRFPDDFADPGVARREKALAITGEYPRDRDFLLLRRSLVETIRSNTFIGNSYYFNGQVFWHTGPLSAEIRRINYLLLNPP